MKLRYKVLIGLAIAAIAALAVRFGGQHLLDLIIQLH